MSVNTFKDAELQIQSLKREIETLKKELRLRGNGKAETVPVEQTETIGQIDSTLTADGRTIVHKLHHLFYGTTDVEDINVNNLTVRKVLNVTEDLTVGNDATIGDKITAKFLDLRNSGNISQIHVSNLDSDQGFYILNLGGDSYILNGAYYNGAAFVAVNTNPTLINIEANGNIAIYYQTNQTPGAGISWIHDFTIFPGSQISFSTATSRSGWRTGLEVYSKAEVDSLLNNKANHGTYTVVGGAGGSVTI